jgi:YD repeat-containing protein
MRSVLLAAVLLSGCLASVRAQQIYDTAGHLIAYKYADGTMDRYVYDSSWRLIRFVSRTGVETNYAYNSDGTMQTVTAPKQ